MRDEDVPIYVVGAGLIGVLAFWQGRRVVQTVVDFTTKGKRLNVTTVDPAGVVSEKEADGTFRRLSPVELAEVASAVAGYEIPLDIYSLARMRRSEGTNGAELRMHVALNDLADIQRRAPSLGISSITDLITFSKYAGERDFYGDQAGRRYASTRDPYEGDVRLAWKVWQDRQAGIDKAGGAVKFVDKSAFGVQKGTRSYEDVLAEWTADGLVPFTSPEATSDFVLFRRG